MKPLRESLIEEEWDYLISKSWNLPCEAWEAMMRARVINDVDKAKDFKCDVLNAYDDLIDDLKRELIKQGYRKDIVEKRVEQSGYIFDILIDEFYKALGMTTGINDEEDLNSISI